MLSEVEAVVNLRLLTNIESDSGEPRALTPADLIIGKKLTVLLQDSNDTPMNLTCMAALRRHAYKEQLSENFWNRWTKEYLLQLPSAHFSRTRATKEVKAGDIVIVPDEKLPRQMWKLSRVLEVYRGADGHVHSCKIRQH